MIRRKGRPFFLVVVLAYVSFGYGATYTLSVNLSSTIRPVTHCASGSLYGITESLPGDITGLLAPLNPNVFTQPALSGTGRQQPIGAAMPISARIVNTTGKVQIRLADVCPGWPYTWPGQSTWLSTVTSVINSKKTSGRTNYDGYEIWNEPNDTWQSANGDFHTVCWKPTYDLIRSLDSGAKIIGPSYSYYNSTNIKAFLTFCKANNCLPEVISWHQWGAGGFIGSVEDYRALETSLGISPRKISINEYSSATHTYEGCPGVSVPFIAKFERKQVESACISWWFTALPGRLGSLLTSNNEKGGGWWLYKWYGDMTGNMVSVTPPDDKSEGIDGFACLDLNKNYASICLGGNNTGTVNVVVSGIPSVFGTSVDAKVEYVTWTNKDTPVSSTTAVSTTTNNVSNGTVTVPVNVTSQFYGYRVYITPKSGVAARVYKNNAPTSTQVNIYTDAVHHSLTISLPDRSKNSPAVYIFNSTGALVKSERFSRENGCINIDDLTSGLYLTKVRYNNQSFIQKFLLK
jgi:hypothetical protein